MYYNPKGGTVPWSYVDLKDGPLFSFGDGMGYGHILYRDFELLPKPLPEGRLPADDTPVLELRFRAENPGRLEEHAVPLLFVTDLESDVARGCGSESLCQESRSGGGERSVLPDTDGG